MKKISKLLIPYFRTTDMQVRYLYDKIICNAFVMASFCDAWKQVWELQPYYPNANAMDRSCGGRFAGLRFY